MERRTAWIHIFSKMGGAGTNPLKVSARTASIGFIGGFITIGLLAFLTSFTSSMWLMAPFGASCVLAFIAWDAPFSQPRSIIGGHLISASVGLLLYHLLGDGFWVIALGVGAAIALMHLTRTTHPPAGANPIVVIMAGSSWSFLLNPVLIGSILIVVIALVINNLDHNRQYPKYWL